MVRQRKQYSLEFAAEAITNQILISLISRIHGYPYRRQALYFGSSQYVTLYLCLLRALMPEEG